MPYIKRAGVKIYYSIEGQGKVPVLFIHGYMGSIERHWAAQIQDPAFQKFQLITMDSRGFNRSRMPGFRARIDIADILLDIACLLDHLGIKKTVIAGYSLGGYVALEFAKNYPSRVSCLVLVSAQPYSIRKTAVHWSLMNGFLPFLQTMNFFTGKGTPNQGFKISILRLRHKTWSLVKIYWKWWVKKYFQKVATYPYMVRRLQEIQTPVLVVHGSKDSVTDILAYEILKKNLPNAQGFLLEGADHGITHEHPEVFNPLMLNFLEKNSS